MVTATIQYFFNHPKNLGKVGWSISDRRLRFSLGLVSQGLIYKPVPYKSVPTIIVLYIIVFLSLREMPIFFRYHWILVYILEQHVPDFREAIFLPS